MPYAKAKVYFDGSHYIAIPHTVRKKKAKKKTAVKKVSPELEEMDEDTFRRTGDTKIYDSSGALIGQLGNERYQYVPYDKISTYIINGVI